MKGPRVVAGTAGGLFLKVPRGFVSRPTQDRVKQALFSSLGSRVPGARVLDLCAGTGSLGIEALSRGATSCVFVEQDAAAVAAIRDNLVYCGLGGEVRRESVERYLENAPAASFDLILLDPPYVKEAINLAASPWLEGLARVLHPDGLLVWEHHARNQWHSPFPFALIKTLRHGETALSFLHHAE